MFHADYEPSTWIPYFVVFLDFFKGVAWPFAAVGIAALFSREIKQLIPNIKQVGPTGLHIERLEQDGLNPDDLTTREFEHLSLDPLLDPIAAEIESNIQKDLEKIPDEERPARMLRALAFQQLQTGFALTYSGILGSQIRALNILNARSVSRSEAQEMFSDLQAENPALRDWTLDHYLRFLVSRVLIKEESGWIEITETGRNFLRFLVEQKLSQDLPN